VQARGVTVSTVEAARDSGPANSTGPRRLLVEGLCGCGGADSAKASGRRQTGREGRCLAPTRTSCRTHIRQAPGSVKKKPSIELESLERACRGKALSLWSEPTDEAPGEEGKLAPRRPALESLPPGLTRNSRLEQECLTNGRWVEECQRSTDTLPIATGKPRPLRPLRLCISVLEQSVRRARLGSSFGVRSGAPSAAT
jgi:hypothetical protein